MQVAGGPHTPTPASARAPGKREETAVHRRWLSAIDGGTTGAAVNDDGEARRRSQWKGLCRCEGRRPRRQWRARGQWRETAGYGEDGPRWLLSARGQRDTAMWVQKAHTGRTHAVGVLPVQL